MPLPAYGLRPLLRQLKHRYVKNSCAPLAPDPLTAKVLYFQFTRVESLRTGRP